jgi:hypothetical protein
MKKERLRCELRGDNLNKEKTMWEKRIQCKLTKNTMWTKRQREDNMDQENRIWT